MTCSTTNCEDCTLEGPRVYGEGASDADIMLVGEAPGRNEIASLRPFVGRAGEILDRTLELLNLDREECYITNLCLCRPPENRDPHVAEIEACWLRLVEEIRSVKPKILVALGRIPARVLFRDKRRFTFTRGKPQISVVDNITGLGTFHPAALLHPKGDLRFLEYWKDMRKMARMFRGGYNPTKAETDVLVVDNVNVNRVVNRIHQDAEVIAYDWETTGLNPETDEGFCLGMSWRPKTAVIWPMDMLEAHHTLVQEIFASENIEFSAFNASFDAMFNEAYNLEGRAEYDPRLMHNALDERPQVRTLERLLCEDLDWEPYETDMLDKYEISKDEMIERIPSDTIYRYCGVDCDGTLQLTLKYREKIQEENPKLMLLVQEHLIPVDFMLRDVQHRGIFVDQDALQQVQTELEVDLQEMREQMREELGAPGYNPNSHPQTQEAVWDMLGFPEPDLYGRKDRSTDGETLKYLQENYDCRFIDLLAEYRGKFTLYSRYISNMWGHLDDEGRVHPRFKIDGAETGRISAVAPPIQQIPKTKTMRSMFCATPGWTMIQADYSQVEMRVAALYSDEEFLQDIFREGLDFHSTMAVMAQGNLPEDTALKEYIRTDEFLQKVETITTNERDAAKAISFGLLYGMGDDKLALSTGLPPAESRGFVHNYMAAMPKLQTWIQRMQSAVQNYHYVESINSRRRRFPFVTESNLGDLQREAVNSPIQGYASDLLLDAAKRMHKTFKEKYPEQAHIIILIHDEVVVECTKELTEEVVALMKQTMESVPVETDIPFPADFKVGPSWGEGEEIVI